MSKRAEHPSLTIVSPAKVRKSEGFPLSPTDKIVSPCSQKLYNLRSRRSSQPFSLEEAVHKQPCPVRDIKLILGSSSVGRRAVVDLLGWSYERMSPDIDEKAIRSADPIKMPVLIATAKASALTDRLKNQECQEQSIIITADQIVLFKNSVREKPESVEQAVEYLSSYNYDKVSTVSAVVVTHYPSGVQAQGVDVATVHWNEVSPSTVDTVVKKGAILNSAGGFCVEDPDLNKCVAGLEGTADSIMGMPVALTVKLIEEVMDRLAATAN